MKTNHTPLLAAFLGGALLASAGGLLAQNPDLPYTSGSTGADGALTFQSSPQGRTSSSVAYDSVRNRVVMFGGTTSNGPGSDTWEWDGTSWSAKAPAAAPPARYNHSMVYDAARQKVVLFGGHTNNGNLNDTWEWDGTNWTQKSPATSPGIREAAGIAYDAARQRVVLFGGYYYLSDTWEWDGTNWAEKVSATVPNARWDQAMTYDANRQRVVMHGGNGYGAGETWEWDGTLWVQKVLTPSPSSRYESDMTYDANRQKIVLFGGYPTTGASAETWEYDGTVWTQKQPAFSPPARSAHAMAYDATRQRVVMFAGASTLSANADDTWEYDGTKWTQRAGSDFYFDMSARATGVWNFTTISIPNGTRVRFIKNTGNTPVTWLATGNVLIDGEVNLDGSVPPANVNAPGTQGKGGPGGYDGGLGGTRFSSSSSYAGTPGQGPGGGVAGTTSAQTGGNGSSSYGNAYLQPLVGGSGGGGGGSNDASEGGNGGGGGGALLIASSLDINVTGSIHANGGTGNYGGASSGGSGSGGSIRLVADRVSGTGAVSGGRLRFEGYFRNLLQGGGSISSTTSNTASSPIATAAPGAQPALAVTSVAGQPVAQPPGGSPASPDVTFSTAGTINITVTATNIPDGTAVTCRVTSGSQVINLPAPGYPAVTLAGGTASFSTTVEPGVGSVQAFASFATP